MSTLPQNYKLRRLADRLVFPESPRWRDGKLWMVDMHAHKVATVDLDGAFNIVHELTDDRPSAIGFQPDGTLLVVSARKRLLLKSAGGTGPLTSYCDLNGIPGDNFNDMVVDGCGRAYLGNRFKHSTAKGPDGLGSPEGIVLVTTDGVAREVANDVFSPNGSVVTPDGKTLIVALSRYFKILAFDIEADGTLSNRRLFADTARDPAAPNAKHDPSPDGICLDEAGGIWFGSPRTGEFLRVLEGGEVTDRIPLPAGWRGLACMLGGPERRDLFLISAESTDEINASCVDYASELKSASKGFVDVVRVDIPGVGWP
jgi:sugar lactone lactonase YvrE